MTLWLTDLALNIPLYVDIRGGCPGHIMLGIVPKGFGDLEVAFECEDGKRIAAILEQSSHASTDSVMAQQTLKHRFKNLDGGADAFFHVLPTGGSATVIVERSDEGALEFLLSFDDAAKFAQSLKSVCSTPPHQIPSIRTG